MELAGAAVISAACIAYNNTVNTWRRFQRGLYVPLNLAFAAGVTAFGMNLINLSADDIGLEGDAGDVWLGLLGALVITAPIFVLAASRHSSRIADRRVAALHGRELAYQVVVRIPLGTALAEEVLFRGLLFAAWRATGLSTMAAALAAAAAFGLWHIAPTVNLVRANAPEATLRILAWSAVGAMVFTTAAGIGLAWLRLATDGLVAPIVLHAGTNSLGTIAAVVAARRSAQATD